MASTNDITGDSLTSKVPTEEYRNNFDTIFRKDKKEDIPVLENDEMWAQRVIDDHIKIKKQKQQQAEVTNVVRGYN
jgi:lysophospholipase L1-like esterase